MGARRRIGDKPLLLRVGIADSAHTRHRKLKEMHIASEVIAPDADAITQQGGEGAFGARDS